MDIPKAMQAKLAAIRDATSLDELTPLLTPLGLCKLRPAPSSMNT